mmetsp:Transcript_7165/g.9686  ORF Transcript_7165/g.9686 Transcript_7165/m.9686 type:complete len:86 (-) Transcript_7165:812-1069(-)
MVYSFSFSCKQKRTQLHKTKHHWGSKRGKSLCFHKTIGRNIPMNKKETMKYGCAVVASPFAFLSKDFATRSGHPVIFNLPSSKAI